MCIRRFDVDRHCDRSNLIGGVVYYQLAIAMAVLSSIFQLVTHFSLPLGFSKGRDDALTV